MGHRILVGLVSACLCLYATHLSALGLGDIALKSALNEPLVAEIKLLDTRELSEEEILVELATPEDFERIGVDRVFFLTGLNFDVVLAAKDGPVIKVTSKNPVREPFLNFIIQTEWPSGKLLREYTILMDLPVYSEDKRSEPVVGTTSFAAPNETGVSNVKPSGVSNPRSSFGQQQVSSQAQSYSGPSYQGDTYAVRPNDTLWEIAEDVRPSGSVSVHQTMIALQEANPNAFINDNINLLKSGQILRIPSEDEILTNTRQAAIQQVAVQNREWAGAGPQLDASSASSDISESESSPEGRLKLSAPEDVYSSNEGRTSGGDSDFSVDALENELSATMEQLDKVNRENSDLRSEVASLEEQMDTLESMLQVANESLRALELSAQKNDLEEEAVAKELISSETEALDTSDVSDLYDQTLEDSAVDDTLSDESFDSELPSDSDQFADESFSDDTFDSEISSDEALESSALDSEVASAENQETQVVATPEPVEEKPTQKVVTQAPKPENSILTMIMDNIIYIVLFIFVMLGAAYYFVRSRNNEDEFDDFLSTVDAEQEEHDDNTVIQNRDTPIEEPEDFPEPEPADDIPAVEDDHLGEQQTEDVVAEADIYIAYGKYDQAEDMLQAALQKTPQDESILAKLLEVYAIQEKITEFDSSYTNLRQFGSPDIIERAEKLRAGIANAPDFDGDDYSSFAPPVTDDSDGADNTLVNEAFEPQDDLDFTLDVEENVQTETSVDDDLSFELDIADKDQDSDMQDTEFALDLADDTELDLDEDKTQIKPSDDLKSEPFDQAEESLESIDFDLDSLELESEIDTEEESISFDFDGDDAPPELEETDDLLSLDLESDDELNTERTEVEFDLSENDLEADLELESVTEQEEPAEPVVDTLEEAESIDEPLAFASEDADEGVESGLTEAFESVDEEFDLGSDADLSALDEELDELTSEMGDLDELDLDIELEAEESDSDLDEGGSAGDLDLDEDVYNLEGDESIPDELPVLEPLADEPVLEDGLLSGDDITPSGIDLGGDDLELSSSDETPGMEEPIIDFDEDLASLDEEITELSDAEKTLEDVVPDDVPGVETSFDSLEEEPKVDINALDTGSTGEFEFDLPEIDPDANDDDSDLDFLSDSDETATKLDLARAYIDMGDASGAKDILREVLKEGNDQQKQEAEGLMGRVDSHA